MITQAAISPKNRMPGRGSVPQLSGLSTTSLNGQLASAKSNGLLPYFRQSARRYNVPLDVLLAMASRETGIGTNGYYRAHHYTGADGHGKGILQIDDRYHSFALLSDPGNNQANITYGAQYLAQLRDQFGNIKDALSAYNAGPSAVQKAYMQGLDPDIYTTGGNYAADVLQRAGIIKGEIGPDFQQAALLAIPAALILSAGGGFLYYQYSKK